MTSTNTSSFRGDCPSPFLQEELFSSNRGFVKGRFCQPYTAAGGNVNCCLSCPITDWVYAEGFEKKTDIANWVNVAALFATAYLLLSFLLLPTKWTHRHYLSICLVISVGLIQLAFVVPLAAKPEQCYDEITPNDMHTDLTCAFSGSFLLFGGWGAVMWVFYRALSLHLQICWEVVPGRKFFYSALLVGWGIPAIGLALLLSLTGVSYRFGNLCHINHDNGLQDFWGPLLAFAAAGLITQVVTLVYCIQVYVRSLFDGNTTTETSSALPSYNGSTRGANARQAYKRVKRVIALQWRGVAIVLLIIAEVVFFSIVFVSMDTNLTSATEDNGAKLEPWLVCLVTSSANDPKAARDACLDKIAGIVTSEPTVLAVLICLALSGFFNLIFLGRWSMVQGWADYFRRIFSRGNEFVSEDARRLSNDHQSAVTSPNGTYPEHSEHYPAESYPETSERMNPLAQNSPADYFGHDAKTYISPTTSFSSPRPPSSAGNPNKGWDPQSTYARGHRFY